MCRRMEAAEQTAEALLQVDLAEAGEEQGSPVGRTPRLEAQLQKTEEAGGAGTADLREASRKRRKKYREAKAGEKTKLLPSHEYIIHAHCKKAKTLQKLQERKIISRNDQHYY